MAINTRKWGVILSIGILLVNMKMQATISRSVVTAKIDGKDLQQEAKMDRAKATAQEVQDWTKRYQLAAVIYAMQGSELLILERAAGKMQGFWSVPSGRVDPGDTPHPQRSGNSLKKQALSPPDRCGWWPLCL